MKNRKLLTAIAAALMCCGTALAASIQEPSTVFYGKVFGTGDAQPFLIQAGSLVWTIRKGNGTETVFNATLFPLHNGQFSYRLDIPHSAVSYELDPPEFGIPLPVIAQTNSHVSAVINGLTAEFIGPSGSSFTAGQITRAQTYRLDMAVNLKAVDSDGDGLPDWWEDLMGLDKQDAGDAASDTDGDGVVNSAEYRNRTNPAHDDRIPSLVTEEQLVFPESVTGIRLVAVDINSTAEQLVYTITQTPENGKILLRNVNENPENPDQQFVAGSQFTQADVDCGRLIFVHDATDAVTDDAFALTLTDGSSSSNASGTVKLVFYREPENPELMSIAQQQRQRAYSAAQRSDAVIWDALRSFDDAVFAAPSSGMALAEYNSSYVPKFGAEAGQVMTGGRGDDMLMGGMADDILTGGLGADTLAGGGGADTFVFDQGDDASDVILDFNPLEGDRINLAGLLAGRSGMVHESVRFQISGDDTLIGLNADAGDTGFTRHVLRLKNVNFDPLAGYKLVLNGSVAVGRLKLQPCVSIAATDNQASENGGNSGVFTVTRVGDLSNALDVNIVVGGSAQNGLDYSHIGPSVYFAPGVSVVTLTVSPFSDGIVEQDEIVEIVLQPSGNYLLDSGFAANLVIRDLQPVVGVEVFQERGCVTPLVPAVFLVTRNGQMATPLFVRLKIGGKATNGLDYQYVNSFVEFAAGQATLAVQIIPNSFAALSGGAETVTLGVVADNAYTLADRAYGSAVLVTQLDTLAGWQSRIAPASLSTPSEFALLPAGSSGIDYLLCYAYGMNPENPDRALLPRIVFRNGRLNVDVHRNLSAIDLQFVVEASTDLRIWSAALLRTAVVPELSGIAGMTTYEAVPVVGLTPRLFVRVRVIYND